ncbi:MAG: hypothetical protein Q8M98_08195 [Candidatus Cloacimonadaceae bacterium]|nr:hypothetical protein [Candidatus Cloacimonadaceae bacterium]
MDNLYRVLSEYLANNTMLKWDIIIELASQKPISNNISFSIHDKVTYRYPFDYNLGYICLEDENDESELVLKNYSDILLALTDNFIDNHIALGNIFILILRSSYRGDYKSEMVNMFVDRIGNDRSNSIFLILINSLSEVLYKQNTNIDKNPKTVDEWSRLFRSTAYLDSHALSYNSIIMLVSQKMKLDFRWVPKIPPVILAILIDFYGLEIHLNKDDIKELDTLSEKEIAFIIAYVIENLYHPEALEWFNFEVADSLLLTHWNHGGKKLINRIILEKTKPQSNNPHSNLSPIYLDFINAFANHLTSDNISKWLTGLEFPEDYITISSLVLEITKVDGDKCDLNLIPLPIRSIFCNSTFDAISKPEILIQKLIINKNSTTVFNFFTLDSVYQNLLTVLCYLLLKDDSISRKKLQGLCFDYKQYFYCGYDASRVAAEFVEFFLLVLLSIVRITGLEDKDLERWKDIVSTITDTVLYPYIAVAEEEEYIWNPEYEFNMNYITLPKYFINLYLCKLFESTYSTVAEHIHSKLSEYKTAVWPYERWETIKK